VAEGDALRTALLRAVSHDLRTPLASIKASVSSLLQRRRRLERRRPPTSSSLTIDEETDRLNRLVGNLLDMSRLETGVLQMAARAVGWEEVVAAATSQHHDRSDTDRVEVTVPETLPPSHADPVLLERSVANVVANALRHTGGRPGAHRGRRRWPTGVELRVIDHGPGVPAARREQLFEPFQRLGDTGGDGVGLGLAVAHGFVAAMGGAIEADETPGGGLTMRDPGVADRRCGPHDPGAGGRRRAPDPPRPAHQPGARGYEVDLAATGEEALAQAAEHLPDVVILDLGLPGIDGIAVVEGLRGWTQVPIIVLSVRDAEADKIAALDAGADDYVTKPFSWASCSPGSAPPPGAPRRGPTRRRW
jgi:two-component system sensor histidine kinase KdpD